MKKYLVILLAVVLGISFVGCKRLAEVKATINVKVVNIANVPQDGRTVYMFTSDMWDAYHRTSLDADQKIVTDSEGIASFDLRAIDLIGGTATFHFVVFSQDVDEAILGEKAISIKEGETKELVLPVLL